jgi:DMSO reductase anchor subunit
MHPAFSVIFFTVTSGLGYGLMIMLVIAHLANFSGALSVSEIVFIGGVSLVLVTLGLLSSTLHLVNPKNAWRAMGRFRTSWLSREGLLAILFYPIALSYLASVWFHQSFVLTAILGVFTAIMALKTIFSTGMIYACLKTIRQWNTALTPANYIWLGLMLGTLTFTALRTGYGDANFNLNSMLSVNLTVIAIAGLLKFSYYFWISTPTGPSINTATTFTQSVVRLLEVGHTAGTFLTDEFGHAVTQCKGNRLRAVVFLFGFVVPAILLIILLNGGGVNLLVYVALAVAYTGILVERWLFFAEARHVVNLYHGLQHT